MDLIEYQDFTSAFVKFVGKRKDSSFGKIEIIQVHIEAIARIAILLPDIVEQKSGLSNAPKSFDPNDAGTPVYLMIKLPDDCCTAGTDQKFMGFEEMFHFEFKQETKISRIRQIV